MSVYIETMLEKIKDEIGDSKLSKRDKFAIAAMQGLIALEGFHKGQWPVDLVRISYKIADAMIAESERGNE